jgi:hypothetical protein
VKKPHFYNGIFNDRWNYDGLVKRIIKLCSNIRWAIPINAFHGSLIWMNFQVLSENLVITIESAEKSSRKGAKAQRYSREKPKISTLSEFFQWSHNW